jgi:hypothetical protein
MVFTVLDLLRPPAPASGEPATIGRRSSVETPWAVSGSSRNATQVVSFNMYGGLGDATERFNDQITEFGDAGTVQSRIAGRWPNVYAAGLQEVCEANLNLIIFELNILGLTGGSGGYHFYSMATLGGAHRVGHERPSPACGAWYGNAILIRGASDIFYLPKYFNRQENSSSGETRGMICVRNLGVVCNGHLENDHGSYAGSQSNEYRAEAELMTWFNAPRSVFMTGDFNLEPSAWSQIAWEFSGYKDGDAPNYEDTTDGGKVYDYVYRKRPSSWSHDAWISTSVHSDHHWKQAYP